MATDKSEKKQENERQGTGLYCFLDRNKACGADCMAWDSVPNHRDYIGKQFANCMILVNLHRTGKHLTVIASSLDTLVKSEQDKARIPVPPGPVR